MRRHLPGDGVGAQHSYIIGGTQFLARRAESDQQKLVEQVAALADIVFLYHIPFGIVDFDFVSLDRDGLEVRLRKFHQHAHVAFRTLQQHPADVDVVVVDDRGMLHRLHVS